ncbi:nucleotide-binding universal stress UspA family protein [Tenacibaculum adriaticum]|uniref:Nucleotide-binding universal stress UspA family protein n=1 Tax=Tenacibaculum adriaticum TaxID=413713 RepID=A0A5S5DXN6_9FLAO|nr:universal stress protein [Tenacibaculum adriaticum]TYP99562.1 nucleotide-binding universal stress UspA family protein [Tenacibaculum adriaticum]
MKTNKNKILLLSDLKKSSNLELKSAVSLAKMFHGEITLFHIKKPTEIVERESQLSTIRSINEKHIILDKEIENLVKPIRQKFNINIDYKLTFGNIKHEIESYIQEYKPDIIVLGKKKGKKLNFIGNNITEFVLKIHKGSVMIVKDQDALQPNQEVSLGVLNTIDKTLNIHDIEELINKTKTPIKTFNIIKGAKSNLKKHSTANSNKNNIEYFFEQSDKALESVSKYVSKNKINLMCLDKTNKKNRDIINKLNVSLLLTGEKVQILQK